MSKEIYLDSDTVKREVVVLWERMKLNAPLIADDAESKRSAYAKLIQSAIAHSTAFHMMMLNLGVDSDTIENFRLQSVWLANQLVGDAPQKTPVDASQRVWCTQCNRVPLHAMTGQTPTCAGCGSPLVARS